MNKNVISLFSFGIFLLVVGAITKVFKWNQASIVLAMGLLFETAALLLLAWRKIKKNE